MVGVGNNFSCAPALIATDLRDTAGAEEAAVLSHTKRCCAEHVGLQSLLLRCGHIKDQ
jgi:hypothetical protein